MEAPVGQRELVRDEGFHVAANCSETVLPVVLEAWNSSQRENLGNAANVLRNEV